VSIGLIAGLTGRARGCRVVLGAALFAGSTAAGPGGCFASSPSGGGDAGYDAPAYDATQPADSGLAPDGHLADASPGDSTTGEAGPPEGSADVVSDVGALDAGDAGVPDALDSAVPDAAPEAAPDAGVDASDAGPLSVLATTGGYDIAIDGTSVYWTDGNASVWKAPITGLPTGQSPTLLASLVQPKGIVVANGTVYVAHISVLSVTQGYPGEVVSFPTSGVPDGGAPTTIATMLNPSELATDGTNVYVGTADSAQGLVGMFPLGAAGDAGITRLAQGQNHVNGLAAAGGYVYWGESTSSDAIQRIFLGSDAGAQIVSSDPSYVATGLAIDSNFVYWTDGFFQENKAPLTGSTDGGPTVFSTPTRGNCIYVDPTYAYWTGTDNTIYRQALPGDGGAPEVVAMYSATVGIHCMTGDSTYVYWVDGSAVRRFAK
jgi:hypothetical protein